jgi:hypothetical protein
VKTGDALRVTFQALVVAMSTDDRCTPDEKLGLANWNDVMTAGGPTTKAQDQLVASILKRYTATADNY